MKNYDQKQSCTGVVLITCSENFHKIPKKASALEPFIKKDSSLGGVLDSFQNRFLYSLTTGKSLFMTTN